MAYRQKSVSHRSGCWDPQGQGACRLCLLRTQFLVRRQLSICCMPSHGGSGEGSLWVSFLGALAPFVRAPPLSCISPCTLLPQASNTHSARLTQLSDFLCLPKIFFEYTNFLNSIFHSFWFSG